MESSSEDDQILPKLNTSSSSGVRTEAKKPLSVDRRPLTAASDSEDSDSDSSDTELVCSVCDLKFSGYIPLKQHEKGSKHKKALERRRKLQKETSDDDNDELSLIQEPYAVCETCDKEFCGPENYRQHMKSKAHKQKVLQASILEQVREDGTINVEKLKEMYRKKKQKAAAGAEEESRGDEVDGSDFFECRVCEKSFSGLVPYTQHLISKTHDRQVQRQRLLREIVPGEKISEVSDLSSLTVKDDVLVCLACSTSFSGPESAMVHLKSQKHSKNFDKYLRKLEKKEKKKKALLPHPTGENREEIPEAEENEGKNIENKEELPHHLGDSTEETDSVSKSAENDREESMCEKYNSYKRAMHSLIQVDEEKS